MPIKINGKDVKNIKLTSNSVTKDLKKVGISGKVLPVWESNRTFTVAFDPVQVTRVDYSLDGKRTWVSLYGDAQVSVPIGTTVYWYSIATGGFEEAVPNEDYWALDDSTGTYPAKVYKCIVGDKNLEVTLGAVAIAYRLNIPTNISGVDKITVLRLKSNFGPLGLLVDGDDIYKEDLLNINVSALPGYSILDGGESQAVTVEGTYTASAKTERKSYTINFINSPESVVSSGWYNSTGELVSSIPCKYSDTILYNTETRTVSIRDLDNSQIIGQAIFKYTDDPTINEKVWISDLPSTMPAMDINVTGIVIKAGASEYSLNINIDSGISKVEYQIGTGSKITVSTNKTILVESGSKVTLTATAKTGYTISGDVTKTVTMGVKDETVSFSSTLNTYDITFDLSATSVSTGVWKVDGTSVGSKATITLHYGDSLIRNQNSYNVVCAHSTVISKTIEFVPDKVTGYSPVLVYSKDNLTVTSKDTITVDIQLKGNPVTVSFYFNTGISKIKYTVNGGAEEELTKNGSPTYKTFDTGTKLKVWAEAATGYTTLYNVSNKYDLNVSEANKKFDSTTTANATALTVQAINYGTLVCSDGRSGSSLSINASYNDTITDADNVLTITKPDGTTTTVTYQITPEEGYDYSFSISSYSSPHTKEQTIKFTGKRDPKHYKLTINADKYTSEIKYKIGTGSYQTVVATKDNNYSATNIDVAFGDTVYYYGVAITGASVTPNVDNPESFTVTHSPTGISKRISGLLDQKTVVLKTVGGGKWFDSNGKFESKTITVNYGTSLSIDTTNKKVVIGSDTYTWVDPVLEDGQELVNDFKIINSGSGTTITDNITITGSRSVKWKTFTFSWKLSTGIDHITYSINGGANQTKYTDGSITVTYGDEISAYAVQRDGYQAPNYSKSNKYVVTVTKDIPFRPYSGGLTGETVTIATGSNGGYWYEMLDSSWEPLSNNIKSVVSGDRILKDDDEFHIVRDTSAETLNLYKLKFRTADIKGYNTSPSYTWYVDSSHSGTFKTGTDQYQISHSVQVTGATVKGSAKSYTVNVSLGTGISRIYAKTSSMSSPVSTTVNGSIGSFPYGTTVELWADVVDSTYNVPAHQTITVDISNYVTFKANKGNVKITFNGSNGSWSAESTALDIRNITVPYGTKYTVSNSLTYATVTLEGIGTWTFTPTAVIGKNATVNLSPYSSGTVTGAMTFDASVTYSSKTYTVSVDIDSHISEVWYKIDSGSWYRLTWDSTGETSLRISHGSKLYSYAIAESGYNTTYNSQTNYRTVTTGATGPITISHTTAINEYTITFTTAGSGGSWTSSSLRVKDGATIQVYTDTSEGELINPTVTIVNQGKTTYNTFSAPATTAANSYKVKSITTTATTVHSDVTVTGTSSASTRKYTLNLSIGNGITTGYYSIGGSNYTAFYGRDLSIDVAYNAVVKLYGTVSDTVRYRSPYSSASPWEFNMPNMTKTCELNGIIRDYEVKFTAASQGGTWWAGDASTETTISKYPYIKYGSTWTTYSNVVDINEDGRHYYANYQFPATPTGQTQTNSISPASGTVTGNTEIKAVVTRGTAKRTITIQRGTGVTGTKYRIGTSGSWTNVSNDRIEVNYGSTVQICVSSLSTGYEAIDSESAPYTITNIQYDYTGVLIRAKLKSISITMATNGYGWWSEESTGGIDLSKPFTVPYGTTYRVSGQRIFLIHPTDDYYILEAYYHLPSDTAEYTYKFSSITAGTGGSSGTVTSSMTITGNTSRSDVYYTVSVYLGTGVSSVSANNGSPRTISGTGWHDIGSLKYNSSITLTATASSGYSIIGSAARTLTNITNNTKSEEFYASRQTTSMSFTVESNNNAGGYWSLDSTECGSDLTKLAVPTGATWTRSGNTVTVKEGSNVLFNAYLVQGSEAHYNYSVSYSPSGTSGTVSNTTIKATTNRSLIQYTITFGTGGSGGSWDRGSMTLTEGTYWSISGRSVTAGGTTNYFHIPQDTQNLVYSFDAITSSTGTWAGNLNNNITITGKSSSEGRWYTVWFSRSGSQSGHASWGDSSISAQYGTTFSISSGSAAGRGQYTAVSVGGRTNWLTVDYGAVTGGRWDGSEYIETKDYYYHTISPSSGTVTGNTYINAEIKS